MGVLTISRGLPGSGKTTVARQSGDLCVSRDDIRMMLYGRPYGDASLEPIVTLAEFALIRGLLMDDRRVFVHDTNLPAEHVHLLQEIADDCGAAFEVVDLRSVPLQVCLARNDHRKGTPAYIPEFVIIAMYDDYIAPENL